MLHDWASRQTAGAKTLAGNHDADRARLTRSVDQKSVQLPDRQPLEKWPCVGLLLASRLLAGLAPRRATISYGPNRFRCRAAMLVPVFNPSSPSSIGLGAR